MVENLTFSLQDVLTIVGTIAGGVFLWGKYAKTAEENEKRNAQQDLQIEKLWEAIKDREDKTREHISNEVNKIDTKIGNLNQLLIKIASGE